jgi:hypothetical protein
MMKHAVTAVGKLMVCRMLFIFSVHKKQHELRKEEQGQGEKDRAPENDLGLFRSV